MTIIDYKSAGVDIEAGNLAVAKIKNSVAETFSKNVLTNLGSFGAMYDLKDILSEYNHPVMVQSIDGVGTKTIIARMMNKFDTIGHDLVSSTVNDIIVLGAKPLTLLDYIANDKLIPERVEQIVNGIAAACKENDISLVGGETAEMPGTYLKGEHDLVGVVTGVLEKDKAVLGNNIEPNDIIVSIASSGLHTNGYSLARKLCFDVAGLSIDSHVNDLGMTIGEALLTPHLNYTKPILHLLDQNIEIKCMAHITGGGLLENIPRVLPNTCDAVISKKAIPALPIFSYLNDIGKLSETESYKTFNMGAGLVMILNEKYYSKIEASLMNFPKFQINKIGSIVQGRGNIKLCE